jgi:zinc transport system ATP-binding protein
MTKNKNHSAKAIVELSDLEFSYNNRVILRDVNLRINALDSTCIVGPNGGGKSTLIKLMLGLLQPNKGTVRLLGDKPVNSRSQVGYVPQYAKYDPLFPVTALDVALMGRLGSRPGRYSAADYDAARAALADLDLEEHTLASFAELSGGQQQRVLIARALVSAVKLLIMDEPTSNIDVQVEHSLMDLLQKLNKRMAVVLVTHDLGFTSRFFKSVVCVNNWVHIHPTSEITGEIIQDMYGADFQMVRHDHRCTAQGHVHV